MKALTRRKRVSKTNGTWRARRKFLILSALRILQDFGCHGKEETLVFWAGAWLSHYGGGFWGVLVAVALCVPFVPPALAKVRAFFLFQLVPTRHFWSIAIVALCATCATSLLTNAGFWGTEAIVALCVSCVSSLLTNAELGVQRRLSRYVSHLSHGSAVALFRLPAKLLFALPENQQYLPVTTRRSPVAR
jgi:hypothetical protein